MATVAATAIGIGDLWELGVAMPFANQRMERFEQFYGLYADADAGASVIYVEDQNDRIKVGDSIYVGPSGDTTRDGSANLINYGQYQTFKIISVDKGSTPVIRLGLGDSAGAATALTYSYLKDDPVTIRGIAESWDFLRDGDMDSISGYADDITQDSQFTYSREDSIDDFKKFSQLISCEGYPPVDTDIGIIQELKGKTRKILNILSGTVARMSCWIRVGINRTAAGSVSSDDIDENIAGPAGNDIDEGLGDISGIGAWGNPIDENVESGAGGSSDFIAPVLRSVFYEDTDASAEAADFVENVGLITETSINLFVSKEITIPAESLALKLAVYAKFYSNELVEQLKLFIDNVFIEHCKGTSKEAAGYYRLDMNPRIGMLATNGTTYEITQDILSVKDVNLKGDPSTRLKFTAEWQNCSQAFYEDMKILQEWNRRGYPIIVRPKMPGFFSYVLLCNMNIESQSVLPGYPGTDHLTVSINFEEISS